MVGYVLIFVVFVVDQAATKISTHENLCTYVILSRGMASKAWPNGIARAACSLEQIGPCFCNADLDHSTLSQE